MAEVYFWSIMHWSSALSAMGKKLEVMQVWQQLSKGMIMLLNSVQINDGIDHTKSSEITNRRIKFERKIN